MKLSFLKNWKHYLQEALGLAIFMISACYFSAVLESPHSSLHQQLQNAELRSILSGILMGLTALFIFYSPFTSPSGSHINPAVTIGFLRLGRVCPWDAFFYILFQLIGGTLAVWMMAGLLGNNLTDPPVNYAVTVPGKYGLWAASLTEILIAFLMFSVVLFTTGSQKLKNFTRPIAACLVCLYVIFAGPVSGFGMNPARSFASALPAHEWRSFWIYIVMPLGGMLGASEFYLFTLRKKHVMPNYRGFAIRDTITTKS